MVPGFKRGAANHPPILVLWWPGVWGVVGVGGFGTGNAGVDRESVPLLVSSVVDADVHLLQLLNGSVPQTRSPQF